LPTAPNKGNRDRSIATLSTMVGALLLARIVNDPALSKRFLDASADAILSSLRSERHAPTLK
jgi:TetR/AcrR family transcriptional repressor of nem operon